MKIEITEVKGIEIPTSLRRIDSERQYQWAKSAKKTIPLEEEPSLIEWQHWRLIGNRFPYDMAYQEHDMLIPKSGAANREQLTMVELIELQEVIVDISNQYDLMFENFKHRRSVLGLYHLHFARYHTNREDFKL